MERGWTCGRWREGMNALLEMVLIEDVLALLMMIEEYWYRRKQLEYYSICNQNAK